MSGRCYLGCGRGARWIVGDRGAAWPCCTRHLPHLLRTARRWRACGVNDRVRVERAR